jgi:hypothetical protein
MADEEHDIDTEKILRVLDDIVVRLTRIESVIDEFAPLARKAARLTTGTAKDRLSELWGKGGKHAGSSVPDKNERST